VIGNPVCPLVKSGFREDSPDYFYIMPKLFQKKVEDFVCEKCGTEVKGNGYTNHCPHCLWSKHVDINPGDRLATCNGMMKPTKIEDKKGQSMIVHACEVCGYEKRNSVSKNDDMEKVFAIAKAFAEKIR